MTLSAVFSKTNKFVKKNSPEILTGLGVAGVISTSYLVGKAAFKAGQIIEYHESIAGTDPDPKERFKTRFKETWRLYIPAGASGAFTIGCIIGASRVGNRRAAAAAAAYSITEHAFAEYREKVIEEFGKNKEQKVRDSIVQDKVDADPLGSREVVMLGTGEVLCCELYTHRYFKSDMETLRKAQNTINSMIINDLYVALSEFYDIIGLAHTSYSSDLGWDSGKLMELNFTTVLSENGDPCLAFDYNYLKPLD